MGSSVETEVKVLCGEVEALVEAHPELGWRVVEERHFEDNFVFELPEAALERRGSILRLRVARGRATLTYKGRVPESLTSALKVREELETGIERAEVLATILERLGLRRSFRYQKYRTTYELETAKGRVLAMRDETPLGGFFEIEGETAAVELAAAMLGFEPEQFIRESYIAIQAGLCRARGVPLQDLVFPEGNSQG
jgi:adenylate cyclase class 2